MLSAKFVPAGMNAPTSISPNGSLTGEWPILAQYQLSQQRQGSRIVRVAEIIVMAANTDSKRQIVALHIGASEAEGKRARRSAASAFSRPVKPASSGRRARQRMQLQSTPQDAT